MTILTINGVLVTNMTILTITSIVSEEKIHNCPFYRETPIEKKSTRKGDYLIILD